MHASLVIALPSESHHKTQVPPDGDGIYLPLVIFHGEPSLAGDCAIHGLAVRNCSRCAELHIIVVACQSAADQALEPFLIWRSMQYTSLVLMFVLRRRC